jgi:DNA repair protein RadC
LARNNKVIARKKISEGGIAGTVVDFKIIFKYAIENLASQIVLCHNHPSGNTKPSDADITITKKLKEAGKIIDVGIIDHIIIGHNNFYSFADEGII